MALAHGWELIQRNKGKGLGRLAEQGLERLHKEVRYYEDHGSRQCSTEKQMIDTFNKLWENSTPLISVYDRIKGKRAKKIIIPDEIDSIVQSLFIGESEVRSESAAGVDADDATRAHEEEYQEALADQVFRDIDTSDDEDEPDEPAPQEAQWQTLEGALQHVLEDLQSILPSQQSTSSVHLFNSH